jgi:S-DNA-T family DNA segregation ATPase FtsK/SpoIIIE
VVTADDGRDEEADEEADEQAELDEEAHGQDDDEASPAPPSAPEPERDPVRVSAPAVASVAPVVRIAAPEPEPEVAIKILEHVEEKRVEKPSFSLDRLVPAVGAGFRLPSTDFFDPPGDNLPKEDPQALYERANQLQRVLSTYGVSGTVADIHTGPTVSTFELIPEEGTRVNKVAGLSDDLALGLACPVRIIAPIPNKNRIGFEIPNKDRIPVNLRELVEDRRFVESSYPLPVVLGRDIVGKPFFADLAAMPHVIVAGATGAGKSVGLNVMLTSLLTRRTPDELRMLMIDPKVVELAPFDKIPHLLLPVVTDMKQAANALKWAVDEMERRYQLFANAGTKNIATFNGWVERCARGEVRGYVQTKASTQVLEDGSVLEVGPEKDAKPMPEKLPYIVIVVDEFADLMMQQGKDVEASVARLAQKARAAGMHVILATQRPSVDVITGMIKANFPTRIAFKVTQKVDSRTILDEMGADQLLGRGDMLVKLNGTNETRRVQCPFVSEEEVQKITDFLRLQGEPVYDERILAPRDEDGSPAEDEDGELDAKYDDAVRIVAETRRCSTSWLQRKLGLGYNRAAKIVETMEKRGIVGPANGAKDREVLIAPM